MKQLKQPNMQDLFTSQRQGWIDECRNVAKRLLRNGGVITSEDVTAIVPRPKYLHPNVTGSIFQSKDFRPVGYAQAKHAEARGHVIRQWVLR